MSTPSDDASGAPLAANSRIMALKFMQRRTSTGGRLSTGSAGTMTPTSAATPTSTGSAGACAAAGGSGSSRAEAEWTLEPSRATQQPARPAGARVLREEDAGIAAAIDHNAALLQFSAGRRSFGSFNPRLEKRLAEIGSNQRAVRDEQAAAARAAETRRQQEAEKAALQQRADEEELIERQNSVSDAELAASFAAKYGKYVPAPPSGSRSSGSGSGLKPAPSAAAARAAPTMELPPVVSNPVRVRDERRGAEAAPPHKKARKGR